MLVYQWPSSIFISPPQPDCPVVKMMSSLSVLVLASCLCLCLTSSWVDICDYQDSYGTTCCPPSVEHSQYYVVPFSEPWEFQQNICQ